MVAVSVCVICEPTRQIEHRLRTDCALSVYKTYCLISSPGG